MNTIVSVRTCNDYDYQQIYDLIGDIYKTCKGPEIRNKKVLLKPNILVDTDPAKCVSTHPVVVEAMIRFLQISRSRGICRRFTINTYTRF